MIPQTPLAGFQNFRRRLSRIIYAEPCADKDETPCDAPVENPLMPIEHLLTLSRIYSHNARRSDATVSNWIVGHARLFSRLRAGQGTTIKTYNRALDWFGEHWPTDLDWPEEVPRPTQNLAEAKC